jgi:hypothetical protein
VHLGPIYAMSPANWSVGVPAGGSCSTMASKW